MKYFVCAFFAVLLGCARTEKLAGGYRVYVTNEISGDLTVIDSNSMDVVATVPLGKRPRGIHPSPDGRTIYVAVSGSPPAPPGVDESTLPPPDKNADGIAVFDVASNKVARILKGGSDPENFDVSLDGKTIYVSNEDASGVSFIDVASGEITKTVKTGEEPEGVKLTPDGKLIYSTSEGDGTVSVVDPAAGSLVTSFKVGHRPRNIVFMPDGKHGYVNAEPDGTVVLFDAVKNEVVQTIPVGTQGEVKPMGLALSPDGKTLFTANGPSNDISVVDLATRTVTKKLKGTGGPWGVL